MIQKHAAQAMAAENHHDVRLARQWVLFCEARKSEDSPTSAIRA